MYFSFVSLQMSAMKAANKDLKGMMKTVKIQEIDVSRLYICISPFTYEVILVVRVLHGC